MFVWTVKTLHAVNEAQTLCLWITSRALYPRATAACLYAAVFLCMYMHSTATQYSSHIAKLWTMWIRTPLVTYIWTLWDTCPNMRTHTYGEPLSEFQLFNLSIHKWAARAPATCLHISFPAFKFNFLIQNGLLTRAAPHSMQHFEKIVGKCTETIPEIADILRNSVGHLSNLECSQ